MSGAIAPHQAQQLRDALDHLPADIPAAAQQAMRQVLEVLESSAGALVLPVDATVSTQQAAELLGVSRMTIVRLIDRGHLAAEVGGVHRRIAAAELIRYRASRSQRRTAALQDLALDINSQAPPDQIISTR